jgi:hypothetical protein
VLSKYTIIGLIVGIIISALGIFSAIDYFTNPIEIMDFDDNFGVGESTIFSFESPENSFQKLMITGDTFDVKISTPDNKEKFYDSYKKKAELSWFSAAGKNTIKIQNTGQSELNAQGTLEKSRDPLFFTYHFLVITAGIVVIGFSAAFSAKKPRGF